MAEYDNREHYIPLRKTDLVDLLCDDRGVDREAAKQFRAFATLVSATFHFEYFQLLEALKDEYSHFDPDTAVKPIRKLADDKREGQLDELFRRFTHLMDKANFKHLTDSDMKKALEEVSDWGINMDVDMSLFERIEIYARGDVMGVRYLKHWWKFWKQEEKRVAVYQRLVILAKLKPSKRWPAEIDTRAVFLKLFKDIPKADLEMLLPGARIRMPSFQRLKLGGSLLGSGVWLLYTMVPQLLTLAVNVVEFGVNLVMGPFLALAGYGYKQYYGYQSTRNIVNLRLHQSLYFQTLGNNLGVISHLLDEAEEQECREALLAYYCLWRHAGASGWRAKDLDDYVEMDLERLANLKVDFEIDDALAKLERLKLVTRNGDRYVAVPIDKALEALDHAWDNYFMYNQSAGQKH